ncbi:hypothetical protein AGMMS49975_26630 [Clostridia bacterium]|nr:hypothetical protein AGMMS49975_26630 [Clostridia bacterium]
MEELKATGFILRALDYANDNALLAKDDYELAREHVYQLLEVTVCVIAAELERVNDE